MRAWISGLMALAMAFALGCTPQQPAEVPPEPPMVSVYEEPTPAPTAAPTPAVDEYRYVFPYADKMQEALDINSDVVGWICIPGTNIDFPIMFSLSPWYYQDRDINKEKNGTGSIYSHFNIENYAEYNILQNMAVAGQNARVSKTMFHDLHHIQEVNLGSGTCAYSRCAAELDPAALPDFSTAEGRTWDISLCGIEGRWEVWSMYETDSEEPQETVNYNTWWPQPESEGSDIRPYIPKDEAYVQEWINTQLQRSQLDLGVEVTTADQFLTIYTSGDNHDAEGGARLYFFLKLVEPEPVGYWSACPEETPEDANEPEATPGPEQAE